MHAKSLQLCLTLCDSIDCSLSGSCPWDFPGKHTGVSCQITESTKANVSQWQFPVSEELQFGPSMILVSR